MQTFLPRLVPRRSLPSELDRYAGSTPTAPVTRGAPPAGYRAIAASTPVPVGSTGRAVEALLSMAVHREAGLLTAMPAQRLRDGDVVIVGVPVGPLALVVPCRVVWVDATGFGYVTLPGHPESGLESFTVADGQFRVGGYSRPAGLSRLGAPVARLAADATIKRYLAAMTALTGSSR